MKRESVLVDWRLASLVFGALFAHCLLLGWIGERQSPTFGELGSLPAGISHLQFGWFGLYRVNPPLVRIVAALPALLADAKTDWTRGEIQSSVAVVAECRY